MTIIFLFNSSSSVVLKIISGVFLVHHIGNGFGFRNYNATELMNATEYAISLYNNKTIWNNIVRQAMKSNNSWERSAKEYKQLYEKLLDNYEA